MEWVYDDGGRAEAGYKGTANDCVCRAIAIAAEVPYQEVYDLINKYGKEEKESKRRKGKSTARGGVYRDTTDRVMEHYGFRWVPTMKVGQGCKVHLKAEELPAGRIVCRVTKHVTAVVDGVIHDLCDCSREETRCVYGYYTRDRLTRFRIAMYYKYKPGIRVEKVKPVTMNFVDRRDAMMEAEQYWYERGHRDEWVAIWEIVNE